MTFRKSKPKPARKTTGASRSPWAEPAPFDLDRTRELETENALLRARVAELTRRLDALAIERADLEAVLAQPAPLQAVAGGPTPIGYSAAVPFGPGGEVVDLDGLDGLDGLDDGSVEAFDEFLSTTDPHLDKVRRFLLD